MKPPAKQYESVKVDEWINGTIKDIIYMPEHEFKGKDGPYIAMAVKIVLELDGYKSPKPSFPMMFSYSERSKLYNLYILSLVEGALPDLDFDLDNLKGLRIRAMYDQKPGKKYQFLSKIRPLEQKILRSSTPAESKVSGMAEVVENESEEEIPF